MYFHNKWSKKQVRNQDQLLGTIKLELHEPEKIENFHDQEYKGTVLTSKAQNKYTRLL